MLLFFQQNTYHFRGNYVWLRISCVSFVGWDALCAVLCNAGGSHNPYIVQTITNA